jgi:hypothetical protein
MAFIISSRSSSSSSSRPGLCMSRGRSSTVQTVLGVACIWATADKSTAYWVHVLVLKRLGCTGAPCKMVAKSW